MGLKKRLKRAKALLAESAKLQKKKGKKVSAEAREACAEAHVALESLIPTRRNRITPDEKAIGQATIALDQQIARHFGSWRKGPIREYVDAIVWALVMAGIIKFFLLEAFSIPSSSMYPTLKIGDHLFVDKIEFGLYVPMSAKRFISWRQPQRGDIVVFVYRFPGDPLDGEDYIKRVIATPGDRIRLENDTLILNGEPIQTERIAETTCAQYYGGDWDDNPSGGCPCVLQKETIGNNSWVTQHLLPGCGGRKAWSGTWPQREVPPFLEADKYFGDAAKNPDWPDVVVPEGHIFVMGDNRDASADSRFWGLVPLDRVKGRALIVFWPFGRGFPWLG